MDDVALTAYRRPESAFDFDGWNRSQSTLPQLMAREPQAAITAPSTDSDPDHVIHSTTTQFRPQGSQRKGKTPVRSHVPTPEPQLPLFTQLQLQRLEREKDAALKELQRIRNQQATNTGLLQRTAADVQNTANTASTLNQQLSTSIRDQLNDIKNIIQNRFNRVDEDLDRAFQNQTTLHNTMERRHQESERRHMEYQDRFTGIENSLAGLNIQPHSPRPCSYREQAV